MNKKNKTILSVIALVAVVAYLTVTGMGNSINEYIEITELKNGQYLFSWDNIPGNDNERLIVFLKQNFDIDWVKTATIEKIDNGKTIKVSTQKNYLSLKLNDEQTEVNLEIDDGRTDKFVVKIENSKLNIYGGFDGKLISVNGTVVNNTIAWSPGETELTFKMTDGQDTMDVYYKGNIPNSFAADIPVVVQGQYSDGLFIARNIIVKCPSKYEADIQE